MHRFTATTSLHHKLTPKTDPSLLPTNYPLSVKKLYSSSKLTRSANRLPTTTQMRTEGKSVLGNVAISDAQGKLAFLSLPIFAVSDREVVEPTNRSCVSTVRQPPAPQHPAGPPRP